MSGKNILSPEEFDAIYLQKYKQLKHYALQVISSSTGRYDPELAEDAVHDTFRVLWEKPGPYLSSPSPDGWLFKTLSFALKTSCARRPD